MKAICNMLVLLLTIGLTLTSQILIGQTSEKNVEIRGVYGNPKPFWEKGLKLGDLGVNAVFVHRGAINAEMVKHAREEGLQFYSEFPTLNGKGYVQEHPEAWAINEKGEKVEAADWFMGVCPTEPGFREFRFNQLRELLTDYNIDGVWMDYVHWHAQFEDPHPILPETCFCDNCLNNFSKHSDLEIPNGTTAEKAKWILSEQEQNWRDWRCTVIYNWAVEMKKIIKKHNPEALLGLYYCPWTDEEYNGARRKILGLDLEMLTEVIDVFSPMVYHGRMERKPEWVAENIKWQSEKLNIQENSFPKIWTIVQAHNSPGVISAEEFKTVLLGGLAGKATGVMMFTTYAVAEDNEKTEVMKSIYKNFQK